MGLEATRAIETTRAVITIIESREEVTNKEEVTGADIKKREVVIGILIDLIEEGTIAMRENE